MKVFCMFEQSGTFKNAFKRYGVEAVDLDILDDFGETDEQVDLFAEIEKAYNGEKSIFDEITPEDLIMAFFPCTRFEAYVPLHCRGEACQQKNYPTEKKLEVSRKIFDEINDMYQRICKLFIVALRGGQRMVVENPVTQPHVLTQYFPVKPTFIDRDRTMRGDYYAKPTQYWFVNFEPKNNFFLEDLQTSQENIMTIAHIPRSDPMRAVKRSLISKTYADRFIREYILDEDQINEKEKKTI